MSAWLTFDLIALVLFASVCVFKIIPSCNVSQLRYRLWRLRDDVVDEIRGDVFSKDDQPRRFVTEVERLIANSQELTPFRLFLLYLSARPFRLPRPDRAFDLDALRGRDRAVMSKHADALERLVVRHLLTGSPSGWLVICVSAPIAAGAALLDRTKGKGNGASVLQSTKDHLREEVEFEDTLALMSRRNGRSHRSLSQCV